MEDRDREEDQAPRRPRVIDKRVSARSEASAGAPEPQPAEKPPPFEPPAPQAVEPPAPQAAPQQEQVEADSGLWTPEQEAEAQRAVDEILRVPARDWVADAAVRLAQVAGVKLDRGDFEDARVAIDGFGALVNGCAAQLGEAERPLRQTLAQLQMAYTQAVSQPPQP
jgi:hypothetical protein